MEPWLETGIEAVLVGLEPILSEDIACAAC